MGTITKTIWKKSKKNPKINIAIITIIKELIFAPGISVRKFSTIKSPPKPRKTREKSDAPMSIKNTIALIFRVSTHESFKISKLSLFFAKEIIIAPNAPNDADSVGVAIPKSIDPRTNIIRIIGGKITLKISLRVIFFLCDFIIGKLFGLNKEQSIIQKL